MTAEFLWINISLMALFFALWVGVPMWTIFKRPDRDPWETCTVPVDLPEARPGEHIRTPADARLRHAKRPEWSG